MGGRFSFYLKFLSVKAMTFWGCFCSLLGDLHNNVAQLSESIHWASSCIFYISSHALGYGSSVYENTICFFSVNRILKTNQDFRVLYPNLYDFSGKHFSYTSVLLYYNMYFLVVSMTAAIMYLLKSPDLTIKRLIFMYVPVGMPSCAGARRGAGRCN